MKQRNLCTWCAEIVGPNDGPDDVIHYYSPKQCNKKLHAHMSKFFPEHERCQCKKCPGGCTNIATQCVNINHSRLPIKRHWIHACQSCNEKCYKEKDSNLYHNTKKSTQKSKSANGSKTYTRIVHKHETGICIIGLVNFPFKSIGKPVKLTSKDKKLELNIVIKKNNNVSGIYRSVDLIPYIGQEMTVNEVE